MASVHSRLTKVCSSAYGVLTSLWEICTQAAGGGGREETERSWLGEPTPVWSAAGCRPLHWSPSGSPAHSPGRVYPSPPPRNHHECSHIRINKLINPSKSVLSDSSNSHLLVFSVPVGERLGVRLHHGHPSLAQLPDWCGVAHCPATEEIITDKDIEDVDHL